MALEEVHAERSAFWCRYLVVGELLGLVVEERHDIASGLRKKHARRAVGDVIEGLQITQRIIRGRCYIGVSHATGRKARNKRTENIDMFRSNIDAEELIANATRGVQMSVTTRSDGASQGSAAAGLVEAGQGSVVQSWRGVWNGVF